MRAGAEIASDVTADCFLGGRITLLQPRSGPGGGVRSGLDAVMLAAACPARDAQEVLEVGCGTGAGLLCLGARLPNVRLTGIEVQPELAMLAERNAALNGMADRLSIVRADFHRPPRALSLLRFDHVIANPPYFRAHGQRAPDRARALARSERRAGDLERWLRFMAKMAKPKGILTLIYRAERLPDLLAALPPVIGGVAILPLWPRPGAPAKLVLLRGAKGGPKSFALLAGLVLHEADGGYTAEAEAVLRRAQALSFARQLL
jgi:tRNA1(Val) A37 N6-methylase TrmN6